MKPGPVLFIAALLWLFLGMAAFFSNTVFFVWIAAGLGMLPFVTVDFFLLLATNRLRAERFIPSVLALGEKAAVTLTLRRASGGAFLPFGASLFDIYPDSMEVSAFPVRLRQLPEKNGEVLFTYTVLPLERGNWEFPEVQLLFRSPLGCWRLKVHHPCISRGRTFPNFKTLAKNVGDLRSILEQTGQKNIRKRGQGMEFMSLREYQRGDSIKAIDWRATGRRRKVIVREYQEEQDQQILLLLDSGYRLHRQEEALPRGGASGDEKIIRRTQFDSALEAALVLSWAALKYGDGVALACFGAEERWFPPRKGIRSLSPLMQNLYDVKSASAPSSLFSALEGALKRLKRRTFIIMISNFREEDGESLSWIIRHIRDRHLLLLVSLREPEAESIARRIPSNEEEALETAAAFAYLEARRKLYKVWEHSGLLTLECLPSELNSTLIRYYLKVKRSGLL
ncbi:MAG: DUF58 domain-containing protein [Spirochaetaceae bacterium]|jgi:uncharacterized protein (DUF58 family)|nr:DUF58 domain-containing protein [Spirochaetaceae bacterium]